MEAASNPTLDAMKSDPILFATAFKKNRFYLFTSRDMNQNPDIDRDIFNERPSKEDIISATESTGRSYALFIKLLATLFTA